MKSLLTTTALAALMMAACAPASDDTEAPANDTMTKTGMDGSDAGEATTEEMPADDMSGDAMSGEDEAAPTESASALEAVLADPRRDEDRARDEFRNPAETMAFFGIEPSHTVAEALPGGGWYSRVLLPYVGEQGRYVALNYSIDTFRELYGDRWDDEAEAQLSAWTETAPAALAENGPVPAEEISAYMLGSIPESEDGQADAVLFIRAIHHMMRFETDYLQSGLEDVYAFLKPGGIVGVVQHRAPEDMDAEMTTGSRGYVKQSDVIAAFEAVGFELDGQSEINANPADTADHEGGVWALGEMDIGESDRMTLRFIKPE